MNCVVYVNQCSDFIRFVYYCLLNEYINQIFEICVYVQNIVFGKNMFFIMQKKQS